MPYSRRSKFRHEHIRSGRGMVRIITKRVAGGKELRIGYDRRGMSHLLSVLTPKDYRAPVARPMGSVGFSELAPVRETMPLVYVSPRVVRAGPEAERSRTYNRHFRREERLIPNMPNQFYLRGRRTVGTLVIPRYRTGEAVFAHAQAHSSPSHHVGTCGVGCRAGTVAHPHRVRAERGF